MKIKGVEINVGDIISVVEDGSYYMFPFEREHIGRVILVERWNCEPLIAIKNRFHPKRVITPEKFSFKEFFTKVLFGSMKQNCGNFTTRHIIESQIKSIKVFK